MNFPSVRDGKRKGKTSFSNREIEFIAFRYGQCKGFKEIADDMGCGFFDAGSVAVTTPVDGVHMDAENTRAVGKGLEPIVRVMLGM